MKEIKTVCAWCLGKQAGDVSTGICEKHKQELLAAVLSEDILSEDKQVNYNQPGAEHEEVLRLATVSIIEAVFSDEVVLDSKNV